MTRVWPRGLRQNVQAFFWSPWVMAVVALAVRLAVMPFVLPSQLDLARDHFGFGFEMGRVARSIATGRGFSSPYPETTGPTALVAPAYPYLLAAIFKVFGVYSTASAIAALSLNNIFSALTCVPLFRIAQRIFGFRVALWSGWVWAFFPYSIGLSNLWIWDTSATTFLFTVLVLLTLSLQESGRWSSWPGYGWLWYGLLWGFTALFNPSVLITFPFLGGWLWFRHRRRDKSCTGPLLASATICVLCLSSWLVRDFRAFGKFIPLRTNFALEFQLGNSDDSSHPDSDHLLPADNPLEMEKFRQMGETAYMAEKQQQVKTFLARQPLRFAWLTLRRIVFTWTEIWGAHPSWDPADELGIPNILAYSLLSLLAFRGFYKAIQNRVSLAAPLLIVVAAFPLLYYVTHPDIRYRHPIDPEIVLLAVYGVVGVRAAAKTRIQSRP